MGIINRKAFPSAIKVRQAVFQEWIAYCYGDAFQYLDELHDPRNNAGASSSIVQTHIDVHKTKCIRRVSRSREIVLIRALLLRLYASSRTFAVAPHSTLKLSFVYELVYFIAGTCFSRKFRTSQRILANVSRQYGVLALRDRISASL